MRKVVWLALLALAPCTAGAESPASQPTPTTQPAPIDPARVAKLIGQLDHPLIKTRDEAAQALEAMGDDIAPFLEKAAPSASFEARARLEELLRQYRMPQTGVIICKVLSDSQAARLGLKAGDIITRVQDLAIRDSADFNKLADPLQNQPRTLAVRSGKQRRTVNLEPGTIGICLADYKDTYGQPLSAALLAFSGEQMLEARDHMADALHQGMVFRPGDCRQLVYALSTYYAGDPDGAQGILRSWASRARMSQPWTELGTLLPQFHPNCMHLRRYASKKQVNTLGGNLDWNLYSARELCEVSRSVEAIVGTLQAVHEQTGDLNDYGKREQFETLCGSFHHMELRAEMLDIIAGTSTQYMAREWLTYCAILAESLGRPDLTIKLQKELFRRESTDFFHCGSASEVIRANLNSGHEADATAFILRLTPEEAAKTLNFAAPLLHRWSDARPVMVDLARIALRHDKLSERALTNAAIAFLQQDQPDRAALDTILARPHTWTTYGPGTISDDFDHFSYSVAYGRFSLALLRGDYATAENILAEFSPQWEVPDTARQALTFLKTHHTDLTDARAPWLRTVAAYPLKTGGHLLLTRDLHMGYADADAQAITEIPPPTERWAPLSTAATILNTQGHQGLVTTSRNTLFVLNAERTRWEPLARLPEYGVWWRIEMLAPAFDNLIPILRAHPQAPVRIMEPDILWATTQRLVSIMLADGTWLSCDLRTGTVYQPRELARKLLNEELEIYAVSNPDRDDLHAFLYTSRGLLDWRPDRNTMTRLELPKVDDAQPVTPSREGPFLPDSTFRVALFPSAGGTTFLVNAATSAVRLEGCINESIPLTYWRQKSIEWKRNTLNKALREANLAYPWSTTAPAPD